MRHYYYLDLKAAFDMVPTIKLNINLNRTDMEPILTRWLTNYLEKRKIRIDHDNHLSKWNKLKRGVPQDSALTQDCFHSI